jgi:hypothetical protein
MRAEVLEQRPYSDVHIMEKAAADGACETRSDILNELYLQALQFSAPGTELRVAVPAGHKKNRLGALPNRFLFVVRII